MSAMSSFEKYPQASSNSFALHRSNAPYREIRGLRENSSLGRYLRDNCPSPLSDYRKGPYPSQFKRMANIVSSLTTALCTERVDDSDGHLKLVSYRNVAPGIKVEIHRRSIAECPDLNQFVREWPVDIVGANTINNKNNNEKKQGIRPPISLVHRETELLTVVSFY